jgi:phage shock protein PspC (stress-responsive transcriptional regulator)
MTKRLYRSRIDKKIAGVCGGMGEYFDIDPLIIRIIFVALAISAGSGILLYLLLWLLVPYPDETV